MISHVRIQNLRSLVDTGFVEIKPLTILLGSNSSGKSTFLRSFPLFTQSVNKPLREPISWFDDAYVDFGDYDTAKSKLAPEDEGIKFSYRLKKPLYVDRPYMYYHHRMSRLESINTMQLIDNSTIEVSFARDDEGTFVNSIQVFNGNLTIKCFVEKRNGVVIFEVNNKRILEDSKLHWKYGPHFSILPEFDIKRKSEESFVTAEDVVQQSIASFICAFCSSRLRSIDKVFRLMKGWRLEKSSYLKFLQTEKYITSFSKRTKRWTIDDDSFLEIYNSLAILNLIASLHIYEAEIKQMYLGCSYIAPMRAAANRYYRTQGLQIRDVDPYGKNLQEFISSLDEDRKKSYEAFTNRVLGLKVSVENSAGHQSIILENKNGNKVNMTDVGFGYSQILPIVTKFWHSNYKSKNQRVDYYWPDPINDIMLIEQPELHLHPAMQASTADVMMLVLNDIYENAQRLNEQINERRIQRELWNNAPLFCRSSMIVETHSQAMINRIGRRIREKKFSSDMVSILLFDKDVSSGITSIKQIGYNDNGQLKDWPFGFFAPKEDDYDILFNK